MPRRAILRFRNPDSTQDLNDRFKDLFNKGFFTGGKICPVPGSLKVDLEPFATAGSDGMFVREDSETIRLDVVPGSGVFTTKNYICIRQEYISNNTPVVEVISLTGPEFDTDGAPGFQGADNPSLIVFGVVEIPSGATEVLDSMISTLESDILDPLGRLAFRGRLESELDLPLNGVPERDNRAGDFYIVTEGTGDFPTLFAWNGDSWINITNAAEVLNLLEQHSANLNVDEIHLTTLQAEAVAGSAGVPSNTNRYVTEEDPRLPTQDENDALAGNFVDPPGLSIEDELPSDTARFVTASHIFAAPAELKFAIAPTDIELTPADGPYYVGTPDDPEALVGSAQKWFNIYDLSSIEDSEYITDQFESVRVTGVFTDAALTQELDPQTDGRVDSLGFFASNIDSLFLATDTAPDSGFRIGYGKRTRLGDLLPQLLMSRGPNGGQVDSRLARLLTGTPNAQFGLAIWDPTVAPGDVVSFNIVTSTFVAADPDIGLTPLGIRGNANNLIMEGLFEAATPTFSQDFLYADKTNPGSLINIPNEWFIVRAISSTLFLVNMNSIALEESQFNEVIAFPESLFDNSVQPGQPVAWSSAVNLFVIADIEDPALLPTGIRGTSNNVIQSGRFDSLSGDPFTNGGKVFAGGGLVQKGTLISAENDFYVGIGVSLDPGALPGDPVSTLLVNTNAVPIPAKWDVEHSSLGGRHKIPFGDSVERDLIVDQVPGSIFIRTELNPVRIEYWNGADWVPATSDRIDVPSGSKMLFMQSAVPTGWTLDTSVHDSVVRVVDNSTVSPPGEPGTGGAIGGDWTITGVTDNALVLEADQLPIHKHILRGAGGGDDTDALTNNGPSSSDGGVGGGDGEGAGNLIPANATQLFTPGGDAFDGKAGVRENTGDDEATPSAEDAHQHGISSDGLWRPAYVNAIICTRD